jgi:CheY-like chemotaxis protein
MLSLHRAGEIASTTRNRRDAALSCDCENGEQSDVSLAARVHRVAHKGDGRVAPITVLVADDEPMVREALADMLNDHPRVHVVAVAGDVAEAVRRARELRPDVAIVDVRMPGGGGAEAARGIRRHSPATRILAFSALDDGAVGGEMRAAGAEDYIVKGAGARRILARVLAEEDGDVA